MAALTPADPVRREAGELLSVPTSAAAAPLAPGPPVGRLDRVAWMTILRETGRELVSDRVSLASAGCAFYATLSLFPAISMLVFIYGLLFDPHAVEPQLDTMRQLLPAAAFRLIAERVHMLVSHQRTTLGTGLLISTVIAIWSSMASTKAMLAALNMASKRQEERGFLRFQVVSLVVTLCAIVGAAIGIAVLVGLPAVIAFLGLRAYQKALLHAAGLAILLLFVAAAIALLYRFGPSRPQPNWRWITPGSLLATLLWLVGSALFSFYVGHIASYDAIYGPLATVVGVMMWFWVSVYVVLLGAELDAARERRFDFTADTRGPALRPT